MKKALLMGLSLVMVSAIAIFGTMAYFTDTASDVNVMTLGNVSIAQHEYQRVVNDDGTYETNTIDSQTSYVLEAFEQGKALLPIVGDPNEPGDSPAYAGWDDTIVRMTQVDSYGYMQVFAGKNAQDKFVTVENTGKTDAYVRTLVAIEVGSTNGALIQISTHMCWDVAHVGIAAIDGNNYMIYECVYSDGNNSGARHQNGVLTAGETTYPSLSQVYLKHTATNEDMVAIDGNGNGTLDILVLSQAVQVDGFDTAQKAFDAAFPKGENNVNLIEWFSGMKAVVAAPEAGATRPAGYNPVDEGTNEVKGVTVIDNSDENTNLRALYTGDGKKVTGDLTVDDCYLDGTYAMNVIGDDTGVLTVTDTDLRGWVSYDGFTEATFTNCTFGENSNPEIYNVVRPYSAVTFENCAFDGTEFWLDKLDGGNVTLINCTLSGVAIENASQLTITYGSADSVIVK